MLKVFIIGATGKTGSLLAKKLVASGHEVHALYRKPGQADKLRADGISPHEGDLVTITEVQLADTMRECNAVVFTAGANGGGEEMTEAIDGNGVVLASKAAEIVGIKRFILVSAFPDAWREKHMPPDFEHYMFVKRQADVFLAASNLDWIIVRPGTLLDSSGTGNVRAGLAIPYGKISRADVAAFIVGVLNNIYITRIIIELTEGEREILAMVDEIAQLSPKTCT